MTTKISKAVMNVLKRLAAGGVIVETYSYRLDRKNKIHVIDSQAELPIRARTFYDLRISLLIDCSRADDRGTSWIINQNGRDALKPATEKEADNAQNQ